MVSPDTLPEEPQAATCPPGEQYPTVDDRIRALLETFAREGKENFEKAECLFALGRVDEALKFVDAGLYQLTPGNKVNRWMHGGNTGFVSWPGIDCYCRFHHLMDEPTKERYKKIYTGAVFYAKLSTANHQLMAALARYLATQVWGPDSFKADPWFMENDPYIQEQTRAQHKEDPNWVWGVYYGKGDPTGEVYLNNIIPFTIKGGPPEYASRPYGAQNILPLLSVADCAVDQSMAKRARFAFELCFVYLAPSWLGGSLATFSPRSYPDTECSKPWGVCTLLWLYFGGIAPTLSGAHAAASAAPSTYRLPDIIVNAAQERSKPYFYRAFLNSWALNHYVNGSYALFSRSPKAGERTWGGQSLPCGVMWLEPDASKGSHLWITSPAADEPGKMGLHTHGIRGYEQEVLGRDALLFVFQTPEGQPFPYALGYIPGGHQANVNEAAAAGKLFLHYGVVLIAVTASHPFDWDPEAGILAPASPARAGDSEFRVRQLSCAVAIETAPTAEFPALDPAEQLRSFREAVNKKSSLEMLGEKPAAARYTNRAGDTLECTFDGVDKVNGASLDYKKWPVAESPWTSQKTGAGPLEVTNGKVIRRFDFTTWEITESPKDIASLESGLRHTEL